MLKISLNQNALPPKALCATRIASLRRRTKLKFMIAGFAWLLLVLALLLTGCSTQRTQPSEPLPLPTRPALSEPVPSVSYSEQWRLLAEGWLRRLTDMHPMPSD